MRLVDEQTNFLNVTMKDSRGVPPLLCHHTAFVKPRWLSGKWSTSGAGDPGMEHRFLRSSPTTDIAICPARLLSLFGLVGPVSVYGGRVEQQVGCEACIEVWWQGHYSTLIRH